MYQDVFSTPRQKWGAYRSASQCFSAAALKLAIRFTAVRGMVASPRVQRLHARRRPGPALERFRLLPVGQSPCERPFEWLREWREKGTHESGVVLPDGIPQNRLGLWVDFKNAGIERTDASGRKVDFRALRHTTCTFLQAVGVSTRVCMEVMRHSEMRLTAKICTDAGGLPTADAINKMPPLFSAKNLTQDLTHALVFKGQNVSRAVTAEKKTPDAQPVVFQAVDTACHNLSASGAFRGMAERGGFGPPVPVLSDTAV